MFAGAGTRTGMLGMKSRREHQGDGGRVLGSRAAPIYCLAGWWVGWLVACWFARSQHLLGLLLVTAGCRRSGLGAERVGIAACSRGRAAGTQQPPGRWERGCCCKATVIYSSTALAPRCTTYHGAFFGAGKPWHTCRTSYGACLLRVCGHRAQSRDNSNFLACAMVRHAYGNTHSFNTTR